MNEFSSKENQNLNPEILKRNWYPAADFLIRRYVKQNKSHPMCNIATADYTEVPESEITNKFINRLKKSSSIVTTIKHTLKNTTPAEKQETKVKRKAKQIINQLIWEDSNFENAAAICNADGTKINTDKSKIKNAIKELIGNFSKQSSEDEIVTIGEKEWYSDFILHRCINVQIPSQTTDTYSVLNPMPVDVLDRLLNLNKGKFEKVLQKSHNYIVPLNIGGNHWVTLFFCGFEQKVYYLDSFGNPPKVFILENTTQPNQDPIRLLSMWSLV